MKKIIARVGEKLYEKNARAADNHFHCFGGGEVDNSILWSLNKIILYVRELGLIELDIWSQSYDHKLCV
jgi:hypothetical protein